MTPAQLQTLKAAIAAETDVNFVALRNSGATGAMADFYNVAATPAQKAWRTSVPPEVADAAPSYIAFDSIVAGKRDSWGFFLKYPRDFTVNKIRNWVTDVWGVATASSNAELILQAGQRDATRGELLFASRTKTTGTVSGLDLSFVGSVTNNDIVMALSA